MFHTALIIFPIDRRGTIMGLIGLVMLSAPAIGPAAAGLIIEVLSWNWILWFLLPFLVFSLLYGLVYGFSIAGDKGWGSLVVMATIALGLLSLLVFSARQFKLDKPMLDLRVLKYPVYTLALLSASITFMIILSSMILLPLYLQIGLGLSAFTAGLILMPGGAINGLLSPVSGRIYDKLGAKWLFAPGFIIMLVMLWNLSNVTTETSIAMAVFLHSSLMVGVTLVLMPMQTHGLNALPRNLYPDGTALINTLLQVSGSIGTALAITIMSTSQNTFLKHVADPSAPAMASTSLTAGVQTAFILGIVLAISGLILSFFIRSSR